MRKLFCTAVLFLMVFSVKAQEEYQVRNNVIKINPLSLFAITGNVQYERAIGANKTFQLGAFYSGLNIGGVKYSGYGLTPELRFYFSGAQEAFNGFYAAPFGRYQKYELKLKETGDKGSISMTGGGALLGWEKMWNGGFTLDVFIGPAYYSAKFKSNISEDEFDLKIPNGGFTVRGGLAVGLGF